MNLVLYSEQFENIQEDEVKHELLLYDPLNLKNREFSCLPSKEGVIRALQHVLLIELAFELSPVF